MRGFCTFVLLSLVLYSDALPVNNGKLQALDPEEHLTTPEIINYWGYPAEEHDGRQSNKTRPAILFMHGLEESSSCWVINLPKQSAGFIYADAGYDVWLGNVRGNTYSKDHISLHPKYKEFWQFSWDEMAKYDLPAMFDKIEKVTGQKQIYYVGHSQGTLIMFAKLASEPTFEKRIKRFFALAPVAEVKRIKGMLKFLADDLYPWIFDILPDGEFLPSNWLMKLISDWVCNNFIGEAICDNIIFLIAGPEIESLNKTRTAVYTSHAPAGTSVQNMDHWTQTAKIGKMQKFDYRDSKKNQQHYGQSIPPDYALTEITGPEIHLYSSKEDYLADPTRHRRISYSKS
ncbi:Lipase [Aphelenchoides bicaudatus]|nr:Lipase [Aphelenchoides bicaudatus]